MQAEAKENLKSILVFLGVIVSVFVLNFALKSVFQPSGIFYLQLLSEVREINKVSPYMLDSETRLDNARVKPFNTVQYNYTLVNYEKKDLDVDILKKELKSMIIHMYKTSPDLEAFREHGTTVIYHYQDKNGVELFELKIHAGDYR